MVFAVDIQSLNPGTAVARGLCLTVAAGPGAASECGDLRIAHLLPATATLNMARAPALIYNSQHAHPFPAVTADVTLPSTASATDSVVAVLKVGGTQKARQKWAGSQWIAGQTRRITVTYDALGDLTNLYAYTLEVTRWYGGGSQQSATASGELVIVNRANSPFGAGWWLAGLEQIKPLSGSTRKLWIGGDGSARVYEPLNDTTWVAPSLTRPDTLKKRNTVYTRLLPGKDTVRFDGAGQHVATTNRLGQRTSFSHGSDRLSTITLPVPAGAPSRVYTFAYDNPDTTISRVTAPSYDSFVTNAGKTDTVTIPRYIDVTVDAARKVTRMTDPDGSYVGFGYGTFANRILNRTDRLGHVSAYLFDAASKVRQVRRYMSGPVADSTDLITNITTVEARTRGTATAPSNAYTRIDGPRTDVSDYTDFYLDRWGAPTRVRDALGGETVLHRGHGRFPALVTRVAYPVLDANGTRRVELASYTARGNLEASTQVNPFGDGVNATTRYAYGNSSWPDFVTRVVPPMKDSVVIGYDANGNRAWQQDARGGSSRTNFYYHASGPGLKLLSAVKGPLTPPDSVFYDTYGNLWKTKSPIGSVTEYRKDDIGRDTLVIAPIEAGRIQRTWLHYDAMGRDTLRATRSTGLTYSLQYGIDSIAPVVVPDDTLTTHTRYDAEGRPIQITAWAGPNVAGTADSDEAWEYDRAGRLWKRTTAQGAEEYLLDGAGNVQKKISTHGDTIAMQHDVLNRLVERITPAVAYPRTTCVLVEDPCQQHYPLYPNDGGTGLLIPADTATFAYDAVGNLLAAHNRDARVHRTYFRSGLVATDTLFIRRYAPADTTAPDPEDPCPRGICIESVGTLSVSSVPGDPYPDGEFQNQVYGTRYGYDLNGRRIQLSPPGPLSIGSGDSITYRYTSWGALETVRDLMGSVFTFGYDAEGRQTTLRYPGGGVDSVKYDVGGRVARRRNLTAYSAFQNDTLTYDLRGKVLSRSHPSGGTEMSEMYYSGAGNLVAHDWWRSAADRVVEEFAVDPLGHVASRTRFESATGKEPTHTYGYMPGGRVWQITAERDQVKNADREVMENGYNAAGQVVWGHERIYGNSEDLAEPTTMNDWRSYWGTDGKLRAHQVYRESPSGQRRGVWEEYRYDALGRRVLLRARADSLCNTNCDSAIERYVWDGDQLLAELRGPGGDSLSSAALESTYYSGTQHGSVLYTHALTLDRPLSISRSGYPGNNPLSIVPHANWRGLYENASWADTGEGVADCAATSGRCLNVVWPGKTRRAYLDAHPEPLHDWMGSLVIDQKDQSGLFYRRNRYYNPQTGQFTQEDPIGIAGGLNTYGYAGGDPVTYSDPFGLYAQDCCDQEKLAAALGVAVATPVPGDELVVAGLLVGTAVLAADSKVREAAGEAGEAVVRASRRGRRIAAHTWTFLTSMALNLFPPTPPDDEDPKPGPPVEPRPKVEQIADPPTPDLPPVIIP